jgi:hypothetical protein
VGSLRLPDGFGKSAGKFSDMLSLAGAQNMTRPLT